MAQGSFKKSGGAVKVKGKGGKGMAVAAKNSRRIVNKGKTAVKKGCECPRFHVEKTERILVFEFRASDDASCGCRQARSIASSVLVMLGSSVLLFCWNLSALGHQIRPLYSILSCRGQ